MGVDHSMVCFLGWEIRPEFDDGAEVSPHGNGSCEADAVEIIAKGAGLMWGEFGDASYGGEAYFVVGVSLMHTTASELRDLVGLLCAHPFSTQYGPPKVVGGVHTW